MSVHMQAGIGYSEASGARYFDMAAIAEADANLRNPIIPVIPPDELASKPWSPWGSNNLLPMEMAADIEACGILNAIIDGKSRFAINNGIQPVITEIDKETGQRVIKEYVSDNEILDWLEENDSFSQIFGWMKDQIGFAQCICRYGLNKKKDPKVISFQRDDITEMRLEKKDSKGKINNAYLAAQWNKIKGIDDKALVKVPHLSAFRPADDLAKRAAAGGTQFAITARYPGWQRHYYSMPLWYAAYKWVKIAQGVPEMKAAIFQNSIHVKYIVTIYESYWTKTYSGWKRFTDKQREDEKKKLYDEIDKYLVGSANAYKSLFMSGYRTPDGKTISDIEIKSVEDNMNDGKLLPDSAAANSEIAFAMHYNNTIMGGNQVSGPYDSGNGGSNIRESVLLQVIHHELERQTVRRFMMVPSKYNGWTERYPGLDYIIPATILTTLDTGSGTKSIVNGDTKKKEVSDGTN